ncbi:CDP-alcohol phosphatidyltransferase family protein [Aquimarina rhabdastrellae]
MPFLLVYNRIIFGILIGILAIYKIENYPIWIVILMSLGLITDIFDGIIARRMNISTEKLRVWDSNVDQFFWIVIIVSVFYLRIDFVLAHMLWIGSVIGLELMSYVISYIKFKKTIATHSILAKFWTISLLWFLIDLTLNATSQIPFFVCIILGIILRIEINLIIIKLKKWTTDVPSIFAVSKINKGIPIKKSKLFNS